MVRVRVAEELRAFLRARDRGGVIEVPHRGHDTVGHVVQSLGVPLTEVGALEVAGERVEPACRPGPEDEAVVHPVARPQPLAGSPRFLLDAHLGTLARRLRVLGIDAAYDRDADDDTLVRRARAEDRVLLTQDRGLLRRRALRRAAYVRGAHPDDQVRDVLDRFTPPLHPFTRCTACGGVLDRVSKQAVIDELLPGTRRSYDDYARCRDCHRIYWRGAHAARLDRLVASVGPVRDRA
ncbi:MAG TPA: Mut7-C RNAse domain-containing protein [Mycobacteriales bacterium]|nr:Mut7-C RNAse domain-containing protein [Mycobacteriales bacterium]